MRPILKLPFRVIMTVPSLKNAAASDVLRKIFKLNFDLIILKTREYHQRHRFTADLHFSLRSGGAGLS